MVPRHGPFLEFSKPDEVGPCPASPLTDELHIQISIRGFPTLRSSVGLAERVDSSVAGLSKSVALAKRRQRLSSFLAVFRLHGTGMLRASPAERDA